MRMNRMSCIILILIAISLKSNSQEINIMTKFSNHFEVENDETDFHIHTDYSGELKAISSVLFIFYKEFISSQDINACVFTPSCSVYAIESIKRKGIITGAMAAMDRMTRCNGLAYGYYDTDKKTNLNIDPVD